MHNGKRNTDAVIEASLRERYLMSNYQVTSTTSTDNIIFN